MAIRKIKSKKGIKIELWETSFRIEGMSKVLSVGRNFTDDQAVQFVDAVYEHCFDNAAKNAKNSIVEAVTNQTRTLLET